MKRRNGTAPRKAKITAIRAPDPDVNEAAVAVVKRTRKSVENVPSNAEISRVMAELGRRGGMVGGRNRAAALTSDQRKEIARKAARSRWDKSLSN